MRLGSRIGLGLGRRRRRVLGGAAMTFASLFGPSDQGFAVDATRSDTLFQDSAGTAPVTAAGQNVGQWADVSGKGNNLTQGLTSFQPTYQLTGGKGVVRPDLSNDTLAVTLAAAITGTFIIAGTAGCIVTTRTFPSGQSGINLLDADGIEGLFKVVGDLVGLLAIGRVLSATETDRALWLYQQKGAGGRLQEAAELVTNGDFTANTSWGPRTGWQITDGTLNGASAVNSQLMADQNVGALTVGAYYVLRQQVVTATAGSFRPRFQGGANHPFPYRSAAGSYAEAVTPVSGNNTLAFQQGGSGFTGSLDNVSLKQLVADAPIPSLPPLAPAVVAGALTFLGDAITRLGDTLTQGV